VKRLNDLRSVWSVSFGMHLTLVGVGFACKMIPYYDSWIESTHVQSYFDEHREEGAQE
jgi:hypothetical protein